MLRANGPLYAAAFCLMFGVGMIVSLLPCKILTLSGSLPHVGGLAAAFALIFVPAQIPVGRWADRYGFRPLLLAGCLLSGLSGLLYSESQSILGLFAGRMIQGLGEVPIWALGPALLAVRHPQNKARAMGLYNAAIHLGLTAGSLAGIWMVTHPSGNLAFRIYAGLCLLGALLIRFGVKEPRRQTTEDTPTAPFKAPRRNTLLFTVLLYGAGYGICVSTIPGFLIQVRGLSPQIPALFFTLFYLGISLSQLTAGPLCDRGHQRPVLITGMALTALGVAAFSQASPIPLLILLTLAATGLGSVCVAALAQLNHGVPDSHKGRILTQFYLCWGIGYFSLPLIMGTLKNPQTWNMGFITLAVIWILTAILHWRRPKVTDKKVFYDRRMNRN